MNRFLLKNSLLLLFAFMLFACHSQNKGKESTVAKQNSELTAELSPKKENPQVAGPENKRIEVKIEKALLYVKDTLPDSYPYQEKTREFQWDKIREKLVLLDSIQQEVNTWAVFQNYKNIHGSSKPVKKYHINEYNQISDSFGVRRYQTAPLYSLTDTVTPVIYGEDGALVKVTGREGNYMEVSPIYRGGVWKAPEKHVYLLEDSVVFTKAIFIDRTNQNIATLEKVDSTWLIRSKTKSTTGRHHPPYEYVTPLGIFVVQQKRFKMIYNVDGKQEAAGYAPYATRFTGGAHIHGVPTNNVNAKMIETSSTLGTIPRSHECVRTVTSHAQFIYDWGTTGETIVFVFD